MKIAILGATGHISKNIIAGMIRNKKYKLYLFSRTPDRTKSFVDQLGSNYVVDILSYGDFHNHNYDVVINGVGIGNPGSLKQDVSAIFRLTEQFDNLVLDYLQGSPDTIYINLSSGAAYGSSFNDPANMDTLAAISINNVSSKDYYSIAKLHSEAKHRSLPHLHIIDLRVFGFFSKYVDMNASFFLTELVSSIKSNQVFVTNRVNIVRDYVHPDDLLQLIELCIEKRRINTAYDVCSLKPVPKFELLDFFEKHYDVKYQYTEHNEASVTGMKINYYSQHFNANEIDYQPRYTSLEGIHQIYKSIMDEGTVNEED